ncbi:6-phosphogluconate dehydrogenase [Cryobacterium flavum]|uniref:6-phosphogluconate dehydrogenase n=1 Tax=Cryobacterium flavum TaxID=1424659 RepID=A0A5E9G2C0_9MICO|nr:6-phosphogluconate dehydrogenase [Cryobacterium flavum]
MSTMNMHIGLIGLGKMGASMRTRLRENGVEVTGYDRNADVTDVATLQDLVDALPSPKAVWVMVPSGAITKAVITEVGELLGTGDLVIDGGNSRFSDDFVHAALLAEKGIDYIDAGVSGGV